MIDKKELEIDIANRVPFIADVARESREASRIQIDIRDIDVPDKTELELV